MLSEITNKIKVTCPTPTITTALNASHPDSILLTSLTSFDQNENEESNPTFKQLPTSEATFKQSQTQLQEPSEPYHPPTNTEIDNIKTQAQNTNSTDMKVTPDNTDPVQNPTVNETLNQKPTPMKNSNRPTFSDIARELKQQTSIVEVALNCGYKITEGNPKYSKWVKMEMKGTGENIVCVKNKHIHDFYFNPNNKQDSGDILNFLLNKNIVNTNLEAVTFLTNNATTQLLTNPTKNEHAVHNFTPFKTEPPTPNDYITTSQAVPFETISKLPTHLISSISSDQLEALLKKLYGKEGAAVFLPKQHPTHRYTVYPILSLSTQQIVGQDIAAGGFKHIVKGSTKSDAAWYHNVPSETSLVVAESPSKALAYQQLNPIHKSSLLATMGTPSKGIISYIANQYLAGRKPTLAFDNDINGQFYNLQIVLAVYNALNKTNLQCHLSAKPDTTITITHSLAEPKNALLDTLKKSIHTPIPTIQTTPKGQQSITIATTPLETTNFLKSFCYLCQLNISVAVPTRKDFNDDLLSLLSPNLEKLALDRKQNAKTANTQTRNINS